MIGSWGFLEELSFVLFPLILSFLVILGLRRPPNKVGGVSFKGIAILLLLLALPFFSGWRFTREALAHRFLSSLTAENVESFSVGDQLIVDQRKKAILVHALRETQWFAPHHDGWAEPVDFRIRLRSGREKYFRIATYLREPGVAIDFAGLQGHGGFHAGYGFNRDIARALTEMGIDLPK